MKRVLSYPIQFWRGGLSHKIVTIILVLVAVILGGSYGVAEWYIHSEKSKPLELGATFIPSYAEQFGLSPENTMDAMISDLHVRRFRLVSYWNNIEPSQGNYDFKTLDWEFKKAEASHSKITLAIGLRQPRWPECHAPKWVNTSQPERDWQPALETFMQEVINRYKSSPALESYQLENEYWNDFGKCPTNPSSSRLQDEFNLVKRLDSSHPILMSRSNNFPLLVTGQPRPDIIGVSVYRKVWDGAHSHRYFSYPLPSWYYATIAGLQKIFTGRDSIIHELQAEPWPSNDKSITQTSLAEQNKTLDAEQLTKNVKFAENTGMRTIDLWGAPYWYYRKTVLHDPSVWNAAKAIFDSQSQQ